MVFHYTLVCCTFVGELQGGLLKLVRADTIYIVCVLYISIYIKEEGKSRRWE